MKNHGAFILKTSFLWIAWALVSCANLPDGKERAPSEARKDLVEHPRLSREEPDMAATRPRSAARDELTITFSAGEVELDVRKSFLSSEAQLFTALYEGLFSYHPITMEPVPGVASQWSVSEDKKQWTFTIRPNARYWNGDPVEAEHFRSAWLSLLSPDRYSPYSSLFDIIEGARDYRMGKLKDPSRVGVIAKDKQTLVVRLTDPAAFFRSMLCHHSFSPIHPSMLEKKNWSAAPPISNGPFYIVEHKDKQMILVKNPSYWDTRNVALNKLTAKFTDDGRESAELWNTGEARWVSGDVSIDDLTDRSGIMVNPMFATHYYFIRSAEKPWNDYRVRRALSLALPWEEIRRGYYLPAKTLVYPIAGYPQLRGIETTDTETARRLLSEAGYPKGVGLPALVIKITPSPEAERVGSLMAQAWMVNLGVPVQIIVVPFGQYFQALKQNDYGVGSTTWIGDFPDPYTFLQMWRRDSNLNDAQYNDADYEKLIDKSMMEDGLQRMETLAEAEKLLLERGSVLPMYYSPALNIVDMDEIDGWYPNALDIHPFKYLSFKAVKPLPGVAGLKPLAIPTGMAPRR